MKLGRLIASIKQELPVTPRHEAWLAENPNAEYSPAAKAFLAEEIGKKQRDRSAAFSASGAGTCVRRRIFGYLGVPEEGRLDGRTISIFHNGTYMHLRWQMAGITAGWLAKPELFATMSELRVKGSLDGVLDTGEGLELKSINSNGFNYVMTAQEPKRQHLGQIGTYFVMLPHIEAFSVIYENKDTQDYKEFVVRRDSDLVKPAREELLRLNDYVDREALPEVKDLCWARQGSEYIQCPFKEICLKTESWTQTQELVQSRVSTSAGEETPVGSKSSVLRLLHTSSSPDA